MLTTKERAFFALSLVVLCAVTIFTFWPSLHAGFTNWDDPEYVHTNPVIHSLSSENIRKMFSEPAVSNYHPLTLLSLAIDYSRAALNEQTGIPDAYPFHQTNIILHIFNVLLVFLVIFRLSRGKMAVAFFTAFLFGIHPMHVESVSWITERKDVLFGFFFLLSLLFYLTYIDAKHLWKYWLSLVFFILSLLSKPAAAPLGLVLLLVDYYRGRLNFNGFKPTAANLKLLGEKLPFLLFGLVGILITYFIQRSADVVAEFQIFTLPQRILISFYGFFIYLQKLLFPVNLSAFYPYPVHWFQDGIPVVFYIYFILSLGILGLTFYSAKKNRAVLFGVLFYLCMLIPVLQFISVGSALISERYTYIPYIGIFFLVGMALDQLWNTKQEILKKLRFPAFALVFAYMGTAMVMARERTRVWNNSATLWTNVIEQFPELPTAYKNRGNYYASEANEPDKALKDYGKLLTLESNDASIFSNLGNIYTMKEEYGKAIEVYSRSIQIDSLKHLSPLTSSYSYNNYLNRGFSLMKTNRYALAISDYSILLQKYPGVEKFHFNRGLGLANTGHYHEAKADFEECLKLDSSGPDRSAVLYNLAACHINLGDVKLALHYLKQAQSAGYPVDAALLKNIQKQAGMKKSPEK